MAHGCGCALSACTRARSSLSSAGPACCSEAAIFFLNAPARSPSSSAAVTPPHILLLPASRPPASPASRARLRPLRPRPRPPRRERERRRLPPLGAQPAAARTTGSSLATPAYVHSSLLRRFLLCPHPLPPPRSDGLSAGEAARRGRGPRPRRHGGSSGPFGAPGGGRRDEDTRRALENFESRSLVEQHSESVHFSRVEWIETPCLESQRCLQT